MAFNKSKALENALKALNQGKVAQAISEYQQILRYDPKDQATLMTVGDLFARQNDLPHAIEYFERLAAVYLGDGFNSKAIAIYKKIAKLAPNELAPLERLADLYVQQGILSEARPLFLQIAEAHLKANHTSRATEILRRLLEIEPDNPRVQMKLAELYSAMGQKKEAAQTYLAYAQRLQEQGEIEEALKLADHALQIEPGNPTALLLKVGALAQGAAPERAIPLLEKIPEAESGGELTSLLLDLELKAGQTAKAADLARRQMARGASQCTFLFKTVDFLLAKGDAAGALPLLRELREPAVEAAKQEDFVKALSKACEGGNTEALRMLVDFCRTTGDPFRLSDALNRLSEAYAAAGDFDRAEELLRELVERNKDDHRLRDRLSELRKQRKAAPAPTRTPAPAVNPEIANFRVELADPRPVETLRPSAPVSTPDEKLDEDTERYVSQALTDVDLFSSYGLTQKAATLLESVLERVPRHAPTLERLLDLHLGAGNDQRTGEIAAQLEQIYGERGDTANAERFGELRQRYGAAAATAPALPAEGSAADAGLAAPSKPETPAAIPALDSQRTGDSAASLIEASPAGPAEFEIALPDEPEPQALPEAAIPAAHASAPELAAPPKAEAPAKSSASAPPGISGEEVDLSEEWEAMMQGADASARAGAAEPAAEPEPEVHAPSEAEPDAAPAAAEMPVPSEVSKIFEQPVSAQAEETIELTEEPADTASQTVAPAAAATEPESKAFELELKPREPAFSAPAPSSADLLGELVAELEAEQGGASKPAGAPVSSAHMGTASPAAATPVASGNGNSGAAAARDRSSLEQLSDVFEEFRAELGDSSSAEEEDLETHYNLGIAYREMGLLDEAIGEFQKVAAAVQKGKPFPYAMNCSTLLALSFMDKGEPKIASLWYQRALETPQLDQESVLALRYDLAVALESAGESSAALDCFRQVYAMNIDYRDVADHIATLQKA